MKKYVVETANPYDILIGEDLIANAGQYIAQRIKPCKLAVVTDSTVNGLYADRLITSLEENGYSVCKIVFPAGEHSKNLATYSNILEAVADGGLSRTDAIVALGGGVVGDISGFSAATYMRGIPYVQIPTTYLSAIDASVGGKTGINLLCGKNLAGAFWQPSLVICDYSTFETLPELKLLDGIAEAIKHAVLSEAGLVESIKAKNYEYVIERCVSIKKSVVEADERDTGLRQLLNFGHTVGHGIEKLSAFSVSHGHAVAKGMVVEARGAYKMGLTACDISGELTSILTELGFDLSVPYGYEEIYKCALMDKKIAGDKISMVVPDSFGKCHLQRIELTQLKEFMRLGLE
ncbi:MAG TPA: 3-dehydroquinate synthase [Anaerovoracaceae bacterium]|nr:3-dehydroquinate synthase [Anaerovoracaceae bacterium]